MRGALVDDVDDAMLVKLYSHATNRRNRLSCPAGRTDRLKMGRVPGESQEDAVRNLAGRVTNK